MGFFTISLPINTIFPLSVVYGIMGACLYYVVMHVCMHEYMYISVYVHVCINVCMYQNKKIKLKIFYSHTTVTLMNMNNISNTVTCKNKAAQKEESRQ